MPQSRKRRTGKRKFHNAPSPRKTTAGGGTVGKRNKVIAAVVVIALVAAGAAYLLAPLFGGTSEVTTGSGLKYTDLVVGTGPSPKPGQTAVVNYTGTLTDGTKFDSSLDHGQPYAFPIGRGKVIKGWDEGVLTMKVGGRRRLVVPPSLGYGAMGHPPDIPPNATLIFDVELLDIK
ncbi:MAG TPA: FKBP-type peptidyl-prolyl cis-trans isomerase [Pyrinomonadaceae bacterium]|nr:FKBP-type peptidyl-prolyl cis-trans isomerase [Pyrinomonadaceae bacterium]